MPCILDEKFKMQAAAAHRQLQATESKNMIEFLKIAQDSSFLTQEEKKEIFISAKESIFGTKKQQPEEKEKDATPAPDEPTLVTETLTQR